MEVLQNTIDKTIGDVSFWIGLIVVFGFAWERFGRRQYDVEELDFPIPVRSFTTRFRYTFAASVYGGSFICYYITLILIGAIPKAQDLIKEWFGTIGTEGHNIGTPIGAAMIATSVVPVFPFVRNLDIKVRVALRDFASIPLKARYIAKLFIEHLGGQHSLAGTPGEANKEASRDMLTAYLAMYADMKRMINMLQRSERLRAARKYTAFFDRYRAVEDAIDESANEIKEYQSDAPGDIKLVTEQAATIVEKQSRYVACAMLVAEPDEYSALKVMSDELKIKGVRLTGWRFKQSQIVLGGVGVFIFGIVGSVLAAIALVALSQGTGFREISLLFWPCLYLTIVMVPIFILPMIFAAGANMYISDRLSFGETLEWDDLAIAVILTFLGCLGSAALTILIVGVASAKAVGQALDITIILPWALLPAFVAMTFFVLSKAHAAWNQWAVDFIIHGAIAVAIGWIAQRLSIWAGLGAFAFGEGGTSDTLLTLLMGPQGSEDANYLRAVFVGLFNYAVTEPVSIAIIAALIGGSLGALQCSISRQPNLSPAEPRQPVAA